jgi:hypothetical protein
MQDFMTVLRELESEGPVRMVRQHHPSVPIGDAIRL